MSVTYRISHLMTALDNTICPPAFLPILFPQFDGSQTVRFLQTDKGIVCEVTFATPQTPVDLGALVRVEIVS